MQLKCIVTAQGTMSPEQLALCRALSDFHNIVRVRDPPIAPEDISFSDHTYILQLYNVRLIIPSLDCAAVSISITLGIKSLSRAA